jgi:hypothetical protein
LGIANRVTIVSIVNIVGIVSIVSILDGFVVRSEFSCDNLADYLRFIFSKKNLTLENVLTILHTHETATNQIPKGEAMADRKISKQRLQRKIQLVTGNLNLQITAEKQELETSTGQYVYRYYFLTSQGYNFKYQKGGVELIACFRTLSELQNWFINLPVNSETFQRLQFFGREEKIKLDADFCLVRIKTTLQSDLNDSFELKRFVAFVDTIYLLNRKSHTHLCELTPSYAMYPLYCQTHYDESLYASLTNEQREEIWDFEDDCFSGEPSVEYMHVFTVDRIIAENPKRFLQIEPIEYEDCETEEEAIESLSEYYIGNRYL